MSIEVPAKFLVGSMKGKGEIDLVEVDTPEPGYGQALIKLEATAICTWEQRSFSGQQENKFPFVGGHEIIGTIVKFGPEYRGTLKVGDRVAIGASGCGACYYCVRGQDRACKFHYDGSVDYGDAGWGPGGFAQYKVHPDDGLFLVGDAPAKYAALAEPLSCAIHSTKLAGVVLGSEVVVIGAGVMGLFNLVAAKARGARVIVSEVDAGRLAKAKELGADEIIDASKEDPIAKVFELTDGRGADVVIAAIGHPKANEQGYAMLSEKGTFVLFASAHPEGPLTLSPNKIHNHEHRVIGSLSSDKVDFMNAAWLIRHGNVNLEPFVQAVYPLEDVKGALEEAIGVGTYRVVVEM